MNARIDWGIPRCLAGASSPSSTLKLSGENCRRQEAASCYRSRLCSEARVGVSRRDLRPVLEQSGVSSAVHLCACRHLWDRYHSFRMEPL